MFCQPSSAALRLLALQLTFLSAANSDRNYFRFHGQPPPEVTSLRRVLSEHAVNGTLIADVKMQFLLGRRLPPEVVERLNFRFLSSTYIGAPMSLDDKSGVVRTAGLIDREAVKQCRQLVTCLLPVDVAVGPPAYFDIIRVTVELSDVNDNAPFFRQQTSVIHVRESASAGSSYALPVATDTDGPQYTVQRYQLASPTHKLALGVDTRRSDDTLVPRMIVIGQLDREVESKYRLTLTAYDGGVPTLSATVDIEVEVLDSNDHSPVFETDRYEIQVPENVPVGTTILRVKAADKDLGENGRIEYVMTSHSMTSRQHGSHVFSIDSQTGDVRVTSRLDRELTTHIELTVFARDLGTSASRTAEVSVIVELTDINDNAPLISVNTLTAASSADTQQLSAAVSTIHLASVAENLEAAAFVAFVSVADDDVGDSARVGCDVMSRDFRLVPRHDSEYQLVTSRALDRESKSNHVIDVTCHDMGSPRMTSRVTLSVVIDDVNDNAPTFTKQLYTVYLSENNAPGASILRLTATDRDVSNNADFDYVMSDVTAYCAHVTGCSARDVIAFSVDSRRGLLTVNTSIDREQYSHFRVAILVLDRGHPPRTGSTEVDIFIDDVNDERPSFQPPPGNRNGGLHLDVAENAPDGHVIGRLAAVDHDVTEFNNRVYYSIRSTQELRELARFDVDPDTGEVWLRGRLDREREVRYLLTAVAIDSGRPSQSTEDLLTITVTDVNDNDPVFVFPVAHNDTVTISPTLPRGHPVVRLLASDLDSGRNARLAYILPPLGDNADRKFDVDPLDGVVYVNFRFEHVTYAEYHVTVVAHDDGVMRRSATAQLVVVVNRSVPFPLPAESRDLESGGSYDVAIVVICALTLTVLVGVALIVLVAFAKCRDGDDDVAGHVIEPLGSVCSGNYFRSQQLTDITPPHSLPRSQMVDFRRLSSDNSFYPPCRRPPHLPVLQGRGSQGHDRCRSRSFASVTCPRRHQCCRSMTSLCDVNSPTLCQPPSCDVTAGSPVDFRSLPVANYQRRCSSCDVTGSFRGDDVSSHVTWSQDPGVVYATTPISHMNQYSVRRY